MTMAIQWIKGAGMSDDGGTVAKARLREALAQARSREPPITKHGRAAATFVSTEEREQKTKRTGNLAQFLAASPLGGSGATIERRKDRPRNAGL